MTPKLNGIDHVHIYVANWGEAEEWYQTVLGFKRIDALMAWAVKNGPLTLENSEGNIHLALFERDSHPDTSAIAFGASGQEFLAWKAHLESHGLELRVSDHKLAYSLYFSDPWGNLHEITTYERDYVAEKLV
jgi:catechol-2,3-dioxygenase